MGARRGSRPDQWLKGAALAALSAALAAWAAGCRERLPEIRKTVLAVIGGPGRTPGRFYRPRALAVAPSPLSPRGARGTVRVYVVDMSGRIQVFDAAGDWQATWHLPDVSRGYPTGLAVAPDGRLAVADTHNHAVRIYGAEGKLLATLGSEGAGPGQFTYVTDVAFDRAGNLFVSERGREDRIQKFDPQGRFVTAWGGSGSEPGRFHRPQGLAVDREGAVYVADAANHRVQKFTGGGRLVGIIGKVGRRPGELMYPYGLAVTPGGYLLVCEYGNNRVQAFDAAGRSRGVWGRAGRAPGEFAAPWGVAWGSGCPEHAPDECGGRIYVADTGNHRVQVLAAPAWMAEEGTGGGVPVPPGSSP